MIVQLGILLTGMAIIACISSKSRAVRFIGFVIGVSGQGFWFWETWRHAQWGMFLLAVWYLAFYGVGVWNNRAKTDT